MTPPEREVRADETNLQGSELSLNLLRSKKHALGLPTRAHVVSILEGVVYTPLVISVVGLKHGRVKLLIRLQWATCESILKASAQSCTSRLCKDRSNPSKPGIPMH